MLRSALEVLALLTLHQEDAHTHSRLAKWKDSYMCFCNFCWAQDFPVWSFRFKSRQLFFIFLPLPTDTHYYYYTLLMGSLLILLSFWSFKKRAQIIHVHWTKISVICLRRYDDVTHHYPRITLPLFCITATTTNHGAHHIFAKTIWYHNKNYFLFSSLF